MNAQLLTLLHDARQAIVDRNYTMALSYIEQAQALVAEPSPPPPFDPTKPYEIVGYLHGLPLVKNVEE